MCRHLWTPVQIRVQWRKNGSRNSQKTVLCCSGLCAITNELRDFLFLDCSVCVRVYEGYVQGFKGFRRLSEGWSLWFLF